MNNSLRDEVEAFIASDLADACEPEYGIFYEKLRAILDRHPPDDGVDVSVEWSISGDAARIYSADFTHDACLQLHGDFGSQQDRVAYAQAICDKLNHKADAILAEGKA